jgi:hypothetical protein
LQCVTGAPKQGLKAANKARRVEFAKKMKQRGMVWKRVMFTDRKKAVQAPWLCCWEEALGERQGHPYSLHCEPPSVL